MRGKRKTAEIISCMKAYIEANRRSIENPLYRHNRADINTKCTEYLLNSIIILKVIPSLLSNRIYGGLTISS